MATKDKPAGREPSRRTPVPETEREDVATIEEWRKSAAQMRGSTRPRSAFAAGRLAKSSSCLTTTPPWRLHKNRGLLMALPDVTITVSDGALGLAETSGNLHRKTRPLVGRHREHGLLVRRHRRGETTLLAGPLLEDVAFHLATAGGPVLAMPVTPSNAGTIGSVTLTGTGVTPGASATGTPRDKYDVVVKIIAGGAVATASFQVSFDGGVTFSPTTATAASITTYVASTGLTLTFAAGTYVANDLYKFSTVAPTYSSSDLNTAIDALLADARDVAFIHVVGTTGGADDAAKITSFVALCTAVATKMATAETAKRWEFAIMEAPEITEGRLGSERHMERFRFDAHLPHWVA